MGTDDQAPFAADGGADGSRLTRRRLLTGALQTSAAVAGSSLLAACGSTSSSSTGAGSASSTTSEAAKLGVPGAVSELPGGAPVRGGTLTVGSLTAGTAENVWPGNASFPSDWARQYSLYNFLLYPGVDMSPMVPGLATSWEPNATATKWIFHLRRGVDWHDGSPFTSKDVVYNFKLWSNAAVNYAASFLTGIVDAPKVRALDKFSVEVPLLKPVAEFPAILAWFNFGVVKAGATIKESAKHPIGTGPFKFSSFTPGQSSSFVANKDYWESGKPYVDKLVVNSSFNDPTSLSNALLGGAVDIILQPSITFLREQLAAKKIQCLQASVPSQSFMFGMRVDKGPFADYRVRQGFKLLIDRQALVDAAFSGVGAVANDIMGVPTVPFYDTTKPVHDVEKAKALFKAAGVAGKTFNWPVAPYAPGMVEAATIMAQQASAAGINVRLQNVSVGTYFTSAGGAYTRPASTNVIQPTPALTVDFLSGLTANAPFRDTWWCHQPGGGPVPTGAAAGKLISQAMGALDHSKAAELWHECQQQQIKYGGALVWANLPYLDATALNVRGLKAGAGLDCNNMRFQDGWLASS